MGARGDQNWTPGRTINVPIQVRSVNKMLTKQPDYTISELGYPQWQQLCDDNLNRKCRPPAPSTPAYSRNFSRSLSHSSSGSGSGSSSPSRLLPLRETLDDYYKRLLLSEQTANRVEKCRDLDDIVAQQKIQKNQRNEQQRGNNSNSNSNNNNHSNSNRRNQKCRDKAQQTAAAATKSTLATGDLNSF